MNKYEYEALEDELLSHEARTLYVLCLRRYMDYDTGLVGTAKRRVSYQQFKEYLSVSRPRRSTIPPFIPSTQQLRGYVEELVRVGLVVRMPKRSKTDPMIFRLPFATTDNQQSDFFRPNEEQHLSNKDDQQRQQQVAQQRQSQKKQGVYGYQQQEEQQLEQHLSNIEEQHTSVTSVNSSHTVTHAHENETVETPDDFDRRFGQPDNPRVQQRQFAMHNDWQPDSQLNDQARTLGVNLSALDTDQREQMEYALVEFRTWWQETKPGYRATQRLWQQKFIQTSLSRFLKSPDNNKNTGDRYGQRHHTGRSTHSGSPTTRPFTEADFDLDASF